MMLRPLFFIFLLLFCGAWKAPRWSWKEGTDKKQLMSTENKVHAKRRGLVRMSVNPEAELAYRIDERQKRIVQMELEIVAVNGMFRECQELVSAQQESVEKIDEKVEHAKEHGREGQKQLKKASLYSGWSFFNFFSH